MNTPNGIFDAPRFVTEVPGRVVGGGRPAEAAKHIPALKDRRGQWAAIAVLNKLSSAGNLHQAIRKGAWGDPAHWQAALRKTPGKAEWTLFVRFIGPGSATPAPAKAQPAKVAPARPVAPILALCTCDHSGRRHQGNTGMCLAGECPCMAFEAAS